MSVSGSLSVPLVFVADVGASAVGDAADGPAAEVPDGYWAGLMTEMRRWPTVTDDVNIPDLAI